MKRLPLIIGMGGVNAAGRSSGHHGYRRLVLDCLGAAERRHTLLSLATMMGLADCTDGSWTDSEGLAFDPEEVEQRFGTTIRDGTLIRRISPALFDPDATHWHNRINASPAPQGTRFVLRRRELPAPLPEHWNCEDIDADRVCITLSAPTPLLCAAAREFPVKAAGMLPQGFEPGEYYNSRFQPRGLQLTVFGASDALAATGFDWDELKQRVRPEQVGVYSGSGFGQLEPDGLGGMLQSRLLGERVTSKQLAMGINSMPTDFISAYVLGSVGVANTSTGACASFLYNLRLAVDDIRSGRVRLAVVGNAEAPVNPWIMEGFAAMGALASEDALRKLDGLGSGQEPDHRRASRPFGENCGFTIGEAAQYFVLCDDELAMDIGACVLGAVSDVFINADGYKKSITAPGAGNWLTFARAVAAGESIVGRAALRGGSFVMAHGSSTPQNRVTESRIFDTVAKAFDIRDWPVCAVKAFVGHTIAPASGDQLATALGVFRHGWLPGVTTIDRIADDVYRERLRIPTAHLETARDSLALAFLNSKGFGGNNATACVLSPRVALGMLEKRHGRDRYHAYLDATQRSTEAIENYDTEASRGDFRIRYSFGEHLIDEERITLDAERMRIPGFDQEVQLGRDNPFDDMC